MNNIYNEQANDAFNRCEVPESLRSLTHFYLEPVMVPVMEAKGDDGHPQATGEYREEFFPIPRGVFYQGNGATSDAKGEYGDHQIYDLSPEGTVTSPRATIKCTTFQAAGRVVIGPDAIITGTVTIGAGSVINGRLTDGVEVGNDVIVATGGFLYEGSTVGARSQIGISIIRHKTRIGEDVVVHDGTTIRESVTIGNESVIGPGNAIEPDVKIGARVHTGKAVSIGRNTTVGDDSRVGEGTFIGSDVTIGNNVSIGSYSECHKGARIGPDAQILAKSLIGAGRNIKNNSVVVPKDCGRVVKVPRSAL